MTQATMENSRPLFSDTPKSKKEKKVTRTAITQAQQIIDTAPEQVKRSLLASLVGSLNASIVGTASVVAGMIERDESIEPNAVEPRDVILMMRGADESDETLTNVRATVRVAQNLRDQLLSITEDDSRGTIMSMLDFMSTASNRKVDTTDPSVMYIMARYKLSEADMLLAEAAQNADDAQRASRLAERRGMIEWLIEHVFTSNSHMTFDKRGDPLEINDNETNTIEDLPPAQMERLYAKMVQSLNAQRDATIRGVMFKDRRYSISDLAMLDASINDAQELDAHADDNEAWLGGETVKTGATSDYNAEPNGTAEGIARHN